MACGITAGTQQLIYLGEGQWNTAQSGYPACGISVGQWRISIGFQSLFLICLSNEDTKTQRSTAIHGQTEMTQFISCFTDPSTWNPAHTQSVLSGRHKLLEHSRCLIVAADLQFLETCRCTIVARAQVDTW